MWESQIEQLPNGRGLWISISQHGTALAYAETLRLWRDDAAFRTFFIALLSEAPCSAYRWETPSVSASSVERPFEFVLLNNPGLERTPDPTAFATHFKSVPTGQSIVTFANLAGDAQLVVPCPAGPDNAYTHLANFIRQAPLAQKHALWQAVGTAMEQRIGVEPTWLSTAGAGVA